MSYLTNLRDEYYLAPLVEVEVFSREEDMLLCTSPGSTVDESSWGPDYSDGMI